MGSRRAASTRTLFVCRECGHNEPRWAGQCPGCHEWNSLIEEEAPKRGPVTSGAQRENERATPVPLPDISTEGRPDRMSSQIGELDRVLGGGLVPGSAVLLGGDPGIGKSTLALQLAAGLAASGGKVLYVAGEESPAQVRLRAERLGIAEPGILVQGVTDVTKVAKAMKASGNDSPALAIIDSVQTIYTPRIESAPGSVSQLREATAEILALARHTGTAVLLIGHVTKDGSLAGPRVLEHMVDTVLYFEGDRNHVFRIVRTTKNRFGPANEIGVFEMREQGLAEVLNPSEAFLGSRESPVPGSVVSAALEGTRPVLVEIEALVAPGGAGSARRTALGVDHGRVAMLAAVLERRLGLPLAQQDLFVNTAGGVRIDDPGVDLAVAAAMASSHFDRALPEQTIVLGEIGLTGEVRAVSQARARLREAKRLGFERAVIPKANVDADTRATGLSLEGVRSVSDAWDALG